MSRALGRYELLRPLARGGMGEVYLARRRAAGVEKWLVVKRMRPEKAGDVRFLDLFVREARLSMSLAHQNIVPVFDFGRIDDQVFLAMERVEGKDLGSSLARLGAGIAPVLAAFVAAECCQALDYAHRRKGPDGAPLGIVHRDVTPRNVLLSWSGEVKLTDFGIAALAGDATTRTIGTPAYMAPEQARGEPLDPRADVYAIGMVLREAVTGARPRPGGDRESTLAAAQRGELAPWPDGFASPLCAIVDRATSADKEARYVDARSLLEALDDFIIAERAAHKADAPARQLAAWLADVWKEARDDDDTDITIDGDELVSFLDDGALDVIGTGTQRSMLATAADDAGVQVPVPAPAPTSAPTTEPAKPRARRAWWLAGAAGVLAIAVGVMVATRGEGPPPQAQPPLAAQQPLPQPIAAPPPVAPLPEPVTSPAPAVPSPAPASPPSHPHRAATLGPKKPADPVPAPVPAPVAVTHKAIISSTPWSYWLVDGDPTKHAGMETIQLTAGAHQVHYVGNEHLKIDKTVTITVPDDDTLRHVEKLAP